MWISITDAWRQHVSPRLTLGHLAACLLISASALANFRYGLELGQTDLEKYIAASASLGADLFNALGLLLVAWACTQKRWPLVLAGMFALLCTVTYSLNAGIGFAASTKDALIAERTVTVDAEQDRAGAKKRVQVQLDALAPARSVSELQPLMDAIALDRRAGGCKKIDGPYTKKHCPDYFKLQAELGRAQKRSELEHKLESFGTQTNKPTNDSNKRFVLSADPLGKDLVVYMAKFGIHLNPDDIRPWQSLLFVFLVVLCGPIALWLADEYAMACRKPLQPSKPSPVERPRPESPPPPALQQQASKPARQRTGLPPAANTTLHRIKANGGKIEATSQNGMAKALKMSRTSMRRAVEALQSGGFIRVDDGNGVYAMYMA